MLPLIIAICAFGVLIWRLQLTACGRPSALAATVGSFVFLFLTATWFISNAFTGEGFNAAVIFHLRVGFEGAGIGEYAGLVVLSFLLTAASLYFAYRFYRKLTNQPQLSPQKRSVTLSLCIWIVCLFHPTVNGALSSVNMALYGPHSVFKQALYDDEDESRFLDYYRPPVIESGGKRYNLVVIYAESLETTYFDETLFPGLITELREFEDRALVFENIRQVEGTSFTIGGIVASQCGVPLITAGHPNSMRGMGSFMSGAVCLGDLLSDQGYSLHYLGGADLSFAGKGSFLKTHGFESVEGLVELQPSLPDPDYVSTWGLFDDSLFEIFTDRFDALAAEEEPFGLFTLTMDTHHPHGHQSRSCKGLVYGDGENSMLNAARCSDHLISEILRKVLDSPAAANTLVVLASDHLALKNDASDMLKKGKRRNLLWVFTPNGEPARVSTVGSSLDTPATISRQLGLSTTAFGLGRDLLGGERSLLSAVRDFNWQLREWRADYAALWELPESIDELVLDPVEESIQAAGQRFKAPALLSLDGDRMTDARFAFDSKKKLYEYLLAETADSTLVWLDECRYVRSMDTSLPLAGLCYFMGKQNGLQSLSGKLKGQEAIGRSALIDLGASPNSNGVAIARAERLKNIADYGVADVRSQDVKTDLLSTGSKFRLISSGGPNSNSSVILKGRRIALQRGIHLLVEDSKDDWRIATRIDPCRKEDTEVQKRQSLYELISNLGSSTAAIVVHDSATCGESLASVFDQLPLAEWKKLKVRQPYVALFETNSDKPGFEMRGDAYTQLRASFSPPVPRD